MGPYIKNWYFHFHYYNPLSFLDFIDFRSLYWNSNIETLSYLVNLVNIPQNPQSCHLKNLVLLKQITLNLTMLEPKFLYQCKVTGKGKLSNVPHNYQSKLGMLYMISLSSSSQEPTLRFWAKWVFLRKWLAFTSGANKSWDVFSSFFRILVLWAMTRFGVGN